MKHALLALVPLTLFLVAAPARAGEEDVLEPTPARTPADVERTMAQHEIPEVELSDEARAPEDKSLVGAVTGQADGRLGFMPLLQHHMGVEHWFLEGLTPEMLGRKIGVGSRLFVRLEGTVHLERQWSPFGGGTNFYGNGLPHGKVYGGAGGGVMGYHESVYRFDVDEVLWVRTRAEFAAHTATYQRARQELERAIEASRWDEALAAHARAKALEDDVGVWNPEDLEPHLDAARLIASDETTWTDDDVAAIGAAFAATFPSAVKKHAFAAFARAAPGWSEAARARLGPALVEAWRGLGYKFQKKELRTQILSALGGPAVEHLEAEIAEAETKLADRKATFEAHLAAHEYAAANETWGAIQPIQAFLMTYEFGDQRTQHWLPSLERCVALASVFDDPERRMALLEEQIRAAVASGGDLPNNSYRPRYPKELDEYFFPRLSEAERRRVEALVLELARDLDPDEDWDGSLVASELLAGVGGDAAAAFFPSFLAARSNRPAWQVEYHRQFAERVRARVK